MPKCLLITHSPAPYPTLPYPLPKCMQKSVAKNPRKMIRRLLERPSGYGVEGNEIGNLAQDVSYLWRELPVPVVAVLHGMCFGAGLQIALGADMRYATPDCQLSVMEGKWGLISNTRSRKDF